MYLIHAAQFRQYNSLSTAELAKLLNISETLYTDIENLNVQADPATAEKLAKFYNVTLEEFVGEWGDSELASPKTDKWHFFPEEPQNKKNNMRFDELTFIEKELVVAFREADAADKEEVFKALSEKTFSKHKLACTSLEDKQNELIAKERELIQREQKLCEREDAVLRVILDKLDNK